ncbi:MAG: arginine decarboxylase [Desulfobacteraceae bacterium 4572_35.1]|nr:MAG: arginine decarboxylase [Desulfobacteraceae bacterium 4572_35.1]
MYQTHSNSWTINDSATLYGIHQWGKGLFDLNSAGNLTLKASGDKGEVSVPIIDIVDGIKQRGHNMPVLLRVENFLDDRIALLHKTFAHAITSADYTGRYRGVFPVKVNQQCQVIEEISHFGQPFNYGLEAGSKAELVLALANIKEDSTLILNGYKDRDFIDLGLWAQKLGHHCFFVVESLSELDLLLERSRAMDIRPRIGARVKVAVKVAGMWTETSGDRSSFGLDSRQLVAMITTLRQQEMLDCLQLLHCHLGSQIPRLADISAGIGAACHYYANLIAAGAAMGYIDFGGGLAVDYSGSGSNAEHSRDYTLDDYAQTIVTQLRTVLDPLQITHPDIITESGRATVAYASMLLFNIIDVMHFEAMDLPQQLPPDCSDTVKHLFTLYRQLTDGNATPVYRHAKELRLHLRQQFQHGQLNLEQRALGENIFLAIAQHLLHHPHQTCLPAQDQTELRQNLADIYYGNFSVFQSLPDTWAIDQKFPIAPLQRHTEKPQREAIISDLTCDCDGKLDSFIVYGKQRSTLPVHKLTSGEDYYLGVFLMGAYQETLGDIHNLFGDTHVISVRINADGGFDIIKEISGDSIGAVLEYVEYQPQKLFEQMRNDAEQAVRSKTITIAERQQLLLAFSTALSGYTYYQH